MRSFHQGALHARRRSTFIVVHHRLDAAPKNPDRCLRNAVERRVGARKEEEHRVYGSSVAHFATTIIEICGNTVLALARTINYTDVSEPDLRAAQISYLGMGERAVY